ncbi:MAG TPA: phospholipase A, partial [Pseudomonadales bacterium]
DSSGDDNPDIHRYMGYGELLLAYRRQDQVLSMLLRNNLMSDSRGAVELNYSFPLTDKVKGYVQYFNGYGESLIDYDRKVERIGIGFAINDFLQVQ